MFLHADSEDSDQTGRMPRLIGVFAGRTCQSVGFVMRLLISLIYHKESLAHSEFAELKVDCSNGFLGHIRLPRGQKGKLFSIPYSNVIPIR